MTAETDNLECILYQLISINPSSGRSVVFSDSWRKVGQEMMEFDDIGGQFKRKLSGEEVIIAKAKSFKTNEEKIDYLFNEVKKSMKWDDIYRAYTNDGTSLAWDKKTGNSTEINLMLYHLLNKSGVKAYPMLLSTHKHGKVNPAYPSTFDFNTTAVYVPLDTVNYYLLDATNKYGNYKDVPSNLLNTFGLLLNKDDEKYDLIFIQRIEAVRSVVTINAEIKAGGKMEGTAQVHSFNYNRMARVENYKVNGEKKYIDFLRDNDNDLKISAVSFENMDVDTLPLTQKIAFNQELTGSDDTYIYFKPNQFNPMGSNPFLSEKRFTDIDFSYRRNYSINGIYKIPAGFKSDVLPKSVSMVTPDKSITFKRLVVEQDGQILVRYIIDYKKSIYFKEDYADLREFYKKMHEMLNEQIVLKKS